MDAKTERWSALSMTLLSRKRKQALINPESEPSVVLVGISMSVLVR